MKVYICDKNKIQVYTLPNKVEDEFIIDYKSSLGIDETITMTAQENEWYILSNFGVTIYKNDIETPKCKLENNGIYKIKYKDIDEYIKMYSFNVPIENDYYLLENRNEIIIDNNQDSAIYYKNNNILSNHLRIHKENGIWILDINDNQNKIVYVNQKRVTKTCLQIGDVIFVEGLKLIWMNTYIIINKNMPNVMVRLKSFNKEDYLGNSNKYNPVKETEKNANLYNEEQVFFHTPRLRDKIGEKIIKIDKPPTSEKQDEMPAFITYGATVMMGISSSITGFIAIFNVASGKATVLGSMVEIVVCLSMILGMVMFPVVQAKLKKRISKKKEEKRQTRYSEYINNKRNEIEEEIKNENRILFENNLSASEIENAITEMKSEVWCREISEDDFLSLRLGLGTRDASIEVELSLEDFTLDDDNLREEAKKIKEQNYTLEDVPITISLVQNNILPIIINDNYKNKKEYINWLMIQLMTYYSGVDLKIAIFTTEDNKDKWEYFKYISHCYDQEKKIRLFATLEDEYKELTSYIEEEFEKRENAKIDDGRSKESDGRAKEKYKNFDKYFLLITDNYLGIKNYEIMNNIMDKENIGFSVLILENTMSLIPSKCKSFIEINEENGTIYNREDEENKQVIFKPEIFNNDINIYSRKIANIPAYSLKTVMSLPTTYNFLEMYKVGKIEQLNISNRWVTNDPTIGLGAAIGIKEDGKIMKLDLHEKNHGPHGLIAGSTGSGKSEFIITYILSMAINYNPKEVQFILIDYKGGGLAGAFENKLTKTKIPHLIGTITNLDTNEMTRTLVSINSEIKRREKLFNETRDMLGESTVDIYKYQRYYREGKVKEPIAHLFIISDEFAELKQQQPEFMDELVSTARVGRSLGIHLILATQKPAGVVNDQIWSNSRFKVCLKVQNTEDSNEMLKRPEAAGIKEKGRFYLQVGTNEIFELAQSAWTGAKYVPTERIVKSYDDSIDIIDNIGNIVNTINDKTEEILNINQGDQLTNIVKFLSDIAERDKISVKPLWLPKIPELVYLPNLIQKYSYKYTPYKFETIIGEYDMPAKQKQDLLKIDIVNSGNILITGSAGSGKENMLTTMIYSLVLGHSPNEINVYIYDFGSEMLKTFSSMPHVGDVILTDDKEKISNSVRFFERELSRRKEILAEYGGAYNLFLSKSEKKMPLILVVANVFEALLEKYPQDGDRLNRILRDGYKYGIVFVASTLGVNSIGAFTKQLFTQKIATQLNDNYDYKYVYKAPLGLVPSKCFGRGIITIDDYGYEFQTAYIYKKSEVIETIKKLCINKREKYNKIPSIPIIPTKINAETLNQYIEKKSIIPLGVNIDNSEVVKHKFENHKILQIIGNKVLNNNNFISELIEIIKETENWYVKVIDFAQMNLFDPNNDYITSNYTPAMKELASTNKKEKMLYIVLGVNKIYDLVLDEGVRLFFDTLHNINSINNTEIILIDNYPGYSKVSDEEYLKDNIASLWLGEDIKIQNIIDSSIISTSDSNEEMAGLGFYITDGKYQSIKVIGTNKETERIF